MFLVTWFYNQKILILILDFPKSWSYLFTTYGYGDNESGSRGARRYPLSYVKSGQYYWDTGRLYLQTLDGRYWSSSIVSSTHSYDLHMYSTRLVKAGSYNKRIGDALRFVTSLRTNLVSAHCPTNGLAIVI